MALIEIDQLLNFIGAILGGGIIGAIISAIVTIRFGERWVETLRIRREHSIILNDEVLEQWLNKVGEYIKIDATYSNNIDKMVGVEPKDPTDLKFFDHAKSHLETKYPNILEAWEELKQVTSEHNKELALLLEEIRTLTSEEFKMPAYYSNVGGKSPEEHITLDRFVKSIYEEMHLGLRADGKWMIGKPKKERFMCGDEMFHELAWGSYRLVTSRDEKDVERAILFVNKIIETPRIIKKVENLMRKDETYKVKRGNFEEKINELIESIKLGNTLKGKCRDCP